MYAKSHLVYMLSNRLRLSPYQSYILERNCKKYDMKRLVKRGGVLYAPYLSNDRRDALEYCSRLMFGPRADLIGSNKVLLKDQRGIKIYATGFYSVRNRTGTYYADPMGNRIERNRFLRIV